MVCSSGEIVYPFFIECFKHISDPYWKSVFEDLSRGVSPYSTYITKDVITCNYKDREFAYRIQRKPSDILYEEIVTLFKTKLGMMSPSEILTNKNDMIQSGDIYNDWSLIKKKNIKETIIERYVIDMKNKFSLSIQQAKYLIDVIFLSLILRVINPSDIHIAKGTISEINGIHFDVGKVYMDYNLYDIQTSSQPEIIIQENMMSDNWYKFLCTLRKLNPN
jgi:hypothetical protein